MLQRIRFITCQSILGYVLVAPGKSGICAIFPGGDSEELVAEIQRRFPRTTLVEGGRTRGERCSSRGSGKCWRGARRVHRHLPVAQILSRWRFPATESYGGTAAWRVPLGDRAEA